MRAVLFRKYLEGRRNEHAFLDLAGNDRLAGSVAQSVIRMGIPVIVDVASLDEVMSTVNLNSQLAARHVLHVEDAGGTTCRNQTFFKGGWVWSSLDPIDMNFKRTSLPARDRQSERLDLACVESRRLP